MFTLLNKAKNWSGSFRVEAIEVLCSVAFLLLFSLSPQLWFGLNELPTAPIVEGLVLPEFLNILLVSALLLAAILLPFDRSGWMSLSAAYLVIFLICYDIHRFQEVTLVFVGAFLLIGLFKRGHLLANQTLQCFVLLLFAQMGIGGLMKLNSYYEQNVFNWLIQPLSQWPLYKYYHYLWFAVPLVEIGTVVCLLFKKTRGFGWLLLVSYHLVMFLLMGPIGVNYGRIHWVSHVLFPIILL
ncbi:MAG: hypothetical protein Q8L68_00480, partial [Methylococcales bacterium]|nr:hypothetical protein [Methylococcales bacterium]